MCQSENMSNSYLNHKPVQETAPQAITDISNNFKIEPQPHPPKNTTYLISPKNLLMWVYLLKGHLFNESFHSQKVFIKQYQVSQKIHKRQEQVCFSSTFLTG